MPRFAKISLLIWLYLLLCPGFPSAQTNWVKYPGNPVVTPGQFGLDEFSIIGNPSVVYDGKTYHMFFEYFPELIPTRNEIIYIRSSDGITWELVNDHLRFFDENSGAQVQTPRYPTVLIRDSTFLMWCQCAYWDKGKRTFYVGFAQSKDGIRWEKRTEPVLELGTPGSFDDDLITKSCVQFARGKYHMWYAAGSEKTYDWPYCIGYATSPDGIHWKKYPGNPVLKTGPKGTWDQYSILYTSVIFNGNEFEMWYCGHQHNLLDYIGYASSPDGVHWTKLPHNPVMRTGPLGSYDSRFADDMTVLYIDSLYHMWYNGDNTYQWTISYAQSSQRQEIPFRGMTPTYERQVTVSFFHQRRLIRIDSLQRILHSVGEGEKANIFNQLALAYAMTNAKTSLAYADSAFHVARKTGDRKGEAFSRFNRGNCKYIQDEYMQALEEYLAALAILGQEPVSSDLGNLLMQIGDIHAYAGSTTEALRKYRQSMEVFLELRDSAALLTISRKTGDLMMATGTPDSARTYYRQVLDLAGSRHMRSEKILGIGAMGRSFSELDSILFYFSTALESCDTLEFLLRPYLLADLAGCYIAKGPRYYQEAKACYREALALILPYFPGIFSPKMKVYEGLSHILIETGQYPDAEILLNEALEYGLSFLSQLDYRLFSNLSEKLETEIDLKRSIYQLYQNYYKLDLKLKNDHRALQHYILGKEMEENIYQEQMQKQAALIQGSFEQERSRNQIETLEQEKELYSLRAQRTTFYMVGIIALAGILLLAGIFYIRQSRLKSMHETLLVEQKLLRSQMNPHFIFNSLADLQGYIWEKDPLTANEYLSSFSRLVRLILENSRQDLVPVEKEVSTITHYLTLQNLRYKGKFDYSIEVDPEIDEEQMLIPPMLAQPFIENSIEHGILPKSTKGHIKVRLSLEANMINIEIEDDGIGFGGSSKRKDEKKQEHQSLAMTITRERLMILNKKYRQNISFTVSDILDENHNILGAQVLFSIPFNKMQANQK